MAIDKAVDSGALDTALTYTANRIRAKTGSTDQIAWDAAKGFGDAVDGISAGAGGAIIKIIQQNLHDPSTDIVNIYLNDGAETTYSGWAATDFISVTRGTLYSLHGNNVKFAYSFFYDADKKNPKALGGNGAGYANDDLYMFVRAPQDGFLRLSGLTTDVASTSVFEVNGNIEEAKI